MFRHACVIFLLALGSSSPVSTWALDVSGRVMDKAERPLAGAKVCFQSNPSKCALSAADGSFRVNEASGLAAGNRPRFSLSVRGFHATLQAPAAAAARIEWFDAAGRVLAPSRTLALKAGANRFALPRFSGLGFLRVSGQGFSQTLPAALGESAPVEAAIPFATAAKTAAARPLLVASKEGYRDNLYAPVADPDTGAKVFLAGAGDSVLFNGTDLEGWSGRAGLWSVEDASLTGSIGSGGGTLLLSQGDYASFRILGTARMKVSNDHLGVCIWGAREANHGYGKCIVFVPPSGSIWDYLTNKDIRTLSYKFPKPAWNHFEIVAHLPTGEVAMAVNGMALPLYKDSDPSRRKRGPIGLQLHSWSSLHTVQYKDLVVEVDPADRKLITVKP